jgi:3-methyladenine DNA glycosylase/8-oxoguanine DNA glycosylase
MRALGDSDAFPSGDTSLLRALGVESPGALERRPQAWRPWRAYAAMYLWTVDGEDCDRRRRGPSSNQPNQSSERSTAGPRVSMIV